MCIDCYYNRTSSMIFGFFIMALVTNLSLIMGHRPSPINATFFELGNHETNNIKNYSFIHGTNIITLSDVLRSFKENHSIFFDINNSSILHRSRKIELNIIDQKTPLFPPDLFSIEERRHGVVILHILGVVYMFVALAIVCDEFFVPSLDVIIEKLDIADDVAGATFMAAGGSAPELFTSVIGVFVSFDDVGIGTIVGSAVFNILFVIGMCAIFSKTVLSLTWWPLFRDCTFYSISLLTLIYFFRDNYIYWYEALVLFGFYLSYVTFMKWNRPMEKLVKRVLHHNRVTRVRSTDQLMPAQNTCATSKSDSNTRHFSGDCQLKKNRTVNDYECNGNKDGRYDSTTTRVPLHSSDLADGRESHARFRHGLLQLMIHTIDPLHDGQSRKIDDKATQLHAIASLKVLLDATKSRDGTAACASAVHAHTETNSLSVKLHEAVQSSGSTTVETTIGVQSLLNGKITAKQTTSVESEDEEEIQEALNMAWPNSSKKKITYLLVAPILFPLWLTLPDTRTTRGKKFFAVTFIGSILWIAAYSYLMVWWANVVGDTVQIPPEVMGLTFLAAGTSIPDLITSVIVARKGFGDMAVSSSVGSNIFDVTVGLPVPWLLYGLIYGTPVEVNSVGMVCSIAILFCMLLFVILSIAFFKWRMNKGLGFTMFLLYFVFVAVSLMFEYELITCPV
ncbi:sodium/potassium/calcium exchanger Nckx30C isoform X3 [Nasonia vitripennis]|uniref:Sodium/calcium exchanger membrane region domain-containing protein n=1 Tax=Nasonia vitripennis TaxID=7425 RepID=A0A7M7T9S4_NASVI|nr:sodium/potassium/calcium exchanger Nckx30C isoform X3 [Nasonia vitripennis]